ncbi:hypothetical protein ACOSP7_009395 [Xanthoceras sorbifolium]
MFFPLPLLNHPKSTGISLGSLFLLIGKIKLKEKYFKRNGSLLLQQKLTSFEDSVDGSKLFSSKELNKATGHFNEHRILGQGGQGTVFKGILLSDGRIVAVKKSTIIDNGKLAEFINEVAILSQMDFFAIGLYAFWAIASFLASLFYLIMPHRES